MDPEERSTTSMNVSLPRSLRNFVEERVANASYTSASEYVRELIRRDRDRQAAHDRVEELLLEGLASGPASAWTVEDWNSLRERVVARLDPKPPAQ